MAETNAPKQRAPRRRWALAQKRRIVELTLHAGASVAAIAREHGVNPNNLRQWQTLYRTGKYDAQVTTSRAAGPTTSATFVPVNVVHPVRRSQPATRSHSQAGGRGVVQLVLANGATLRIETGALDAALVCALVAELQR
jgi:transposase